MKKNIEIVAMIYKSVDYLNFIYGQMKSEYCKADGWEVGLRIVANDANEKVLNRLKELDIPYTIYNDPKPNDFYLNRVYRCFNFCVTSSKYDNVCLINSDLLFSEKWLDNILKHHDGVNIPVSRLIESGKMPSGKYAGSINVGRHPKDLNIDMWSEICKSVSQDSVMEGGLYGPVVFERERFIESGMYPEGNVYDYGFGFDSSKGSVYQGLIKASDDYLFHDILEKKFNMKHITVFDSLVYHIQEGEKDE